MKTAKATKGQPEFDEEIRVPRFIWRVTRAWHPVKNDEEGLKILWAGQQKLLEAFDLQFPDQRQPALTVHPALPTLPALQARPRQPALTVPPALPTLPALQARPAPPTEALTITPAISPPAGPAPIPISPILPGLRNRRLQFPPSLSHVVQWVYLRHALNQPNSNTHNCNPAPAPNHVSSHLLPGLPHQNT